MISNRPKIEIYSLLAVYAFPPLSAVVFALVSFPELAKLIVKFFGLEVESLANDSSLLLYVRITCIILGFLLNFLSICHSRKESASLSRANETLLRREKKLEETRKKLSKRDAKWEQFKGESFDGIKKFMDSYLRNFVTDYFRKLPDYNEPPSTLRVSIYTYDRSKDICFLVGRYSFNTRYTQSRRKAYPVDNGAIGRAWTDGEAKITISANADEDFDEWKKELSEVYGMPSDIIESLTMKSHAFLSQRINGGYDGNLPIGVALVETTNIELTQEEKILLPTLLKDDLAVIKNFIHYDYELHEKYPRRQKG